MKNLCFSNIFIEKQSDLRLHPLIQHLLRHNDIAYRFFPQIDKHLMLTTTKPLIQQGFLKSYKNTPTKGKSLKDLPFQSVKEPQFLLSENWVLVYWWQNTNSISKIKELLQSPYIFTK